jgi:tetrahydromethanopterin S-methyltransferase subunit G
MRRVSSQIIAASPNDLKNNRLGLMSQEQLETLQEQIDHFQARLSQLTSRAVKLAVGITFAVVLLTFVRVILLPLALAIEVAVVGVMLYLTTDYNRFVQQLTLDREAEAVRIVKGRTSRYTLRTHPLYNTLRIELQTYKLLDGGLAKQFITGELYQYYVLPQSGVVIAAECIGEKISRYLL